MGHPVTNEWDIPPPPRTHTRPIPWGQWDGIGFTLALASPLLSCEPIN